MIQYVVTRRHAHTMRDFVDLWAPEIAPWVAVVSYDSLLQRASLPRATYIFSDIERLHPDWLPALEAIWKVLGDEGAGLRPLNHPSRSLKRYELLKTLHARGINPHTVYRPGEIPARPAFPVFVRGENDHDGSLTGLIHSASELAVALEGLPSRRAAARLIVEFCDTAAADGRYRKYSAYVVGERVFPQLLMFGNGWQVKGMAELARRKEDLRREREYIQSNPHQRQLREIFALANIQYGRIDYAVKDGQPVVWEINTNPMLMITTAIRQRRVSMRPPFVKQMIDALAAVNCPADPGNVLDSPVASHGWAGRVRRESAALRDRIDYLLQGLVTRQRKRLLGAIRSRAGRIAPYRRKSGTVL